MKNKPSKKQSSVAKKKANSPLRKEKEVFQNPDPHIDQDFPGYPHAPARKELIDPKTSVEKKIAGMEIKDGEKMNKREKKKGRNWDEQQSDGSGGVFGATEWVKDDEDVY